MPLIIFDIDGTLVDSQAHILEAQGVAFAAHGMTAPPRKTALSVVGLSLAEAFTVLAGPDGPVDSLAEAYKDAWGDLRGKPDYEEILYPGAADLVADLAARGVILGIATGKSQRGVERLLSARGWHRFFATVQTADGHPSKPSPSMISACLAETGIDAGETVMVGDTSYDMAMAVAGGVAPIGVSWGYHEPSALVAAGARTVADDMATLRTILFSSSWQDRT